MEYYSSHNLSKKRKRRRSSNEEEIVKKPQVVLHNHNIPHDIVDDILTRLPVKSLLRFKAVSKLWRSTISNPSFHKRRRLPGHTRIFAMVGVQPLFYSLDKKGCTEKFNVPALPPLGSKNSHTEISNSCDGMLLLRLDACIFLLNPTTHYMDRVLTLDKRRNQHNHVFRRMGFCYDESIGDYKAIIFSSGIVASLKEKKLTKLHRPMNVRCFSPGPLVNDRLHATADQNEIVYFNPIKDVFEKLACPNSISRGMYSIIIGLGVLEGCLCMARWIGRVDIEVMKMKEYGVGDSWITLFVLKDLEMSRYYNSFEPLLRTDNGDILIRNQGQLWSYNLAIKEKYTICTNMLLINEAVTFEENLFSPNGSRSVSDYRRSCGGGKC